MHISRTFQFLLNLLAFSNIFIAFCAYLLYKFCLECAFGLKGDIKLDVFIFSSTLFMYLFHRKVDQFQESKTQKNRYERWNIQHSNIERLLILISFICSFYLLHIFSAISFVLLLPIGLICLTYILRVLPLKYNHLRAIPFAKSAIIAFVWTFSLAILPLVHVQNSLNIEQEGLLLSSIIFLYVLCQVIIFDLKDIKTDTLQGLKTFATHFGIKPTKQICGVIILIIGVITFLSGFNHSIIFSIGLSLLLLIILVWFAKAHLRPLFFYIVLESSLAFPFLFFKISEYIF